MTKEKLDLLYSLAAKPGARLIGSERRGCGWNTRLYVLEIELDPTWEDYRREQLYASSSFASYYGAVICAKAVLEAARKQRRPAVRNRREGAKDGSSRRRTNNGSARASTAA